MSQKELEGVEDAGIHQSQHPLQTSELDGESKDEVHTPASARRRDSEHGAGGGIQRQQSNTSVWASETMSLTQEVLFITTVCMTQFCNQASFSSMLFLINHIGQSLNVTNQGLLSWLVAGFSLTAGTFLIFAGRLGDAFGYRLMMMLAFAWFAAWSVVCGLAVYPASYTLFVFARVLQGIGSAMCMPNALAVLGATYPPGSRKAMVFALFGASAPTGAAAGFMVGTALDLLWWPWVFFALAITLCVLTVVTYFVVPAPPGKLGVVVTWQNCVAELDLLGGATGVSALILFNFAWNQAPIAGWASAEVIVTLIAGIALFIAFMWVEFRPANKNPLLPFDAFNPDVGFVLGALACGWAMFGIWALYGVQLLENVRNLPPLQAAVWFLPIGVTGLLASVITGALLGRWQFRPATVMTIALFFFLLGNTLFTTAPVDQIYWGQTFVSIVVIPFGMDMSFPAATLIVSNAVKKEHQGIAASLVATVVNYSISLGVGFAGTVEVHVNNGGTTREDVLRGYRAALYLGVGLAGLGFLICLAFVWKDRVRDAQASKQEKMASSPRL